MNQVNDISPEAWAEAAAEFRSTRDRGGPVSRQPQKPPPEPARKSRFYSAAELKGKPVPSRQWLVPDLVPQKTVTLFGGDGG